MSENVSTEQRKTSSFLVKIKNISFDQAAAAVLFWGTLLLPLVFIPAISLSIDISKTLFLAAIVLLGFLFWILGRLKSGSIVIPLHPLFTAAGIIVLVHIVSALFSPAVRNSFFGFAYETGTVVSIILLFLFMFLIALFFGEQKHVSRLYQGLLCVFGVVFVFQIIRLFPAIDFLSFGGFFAEKTGNLIGKWNDLGIFAGMVILLSFITLEKVRPSGRVKIILYGTLLLSLLTLSVVNFNLVWIVVGIFSLIIFVYNFSLSYFAKDKSVDEKKGVFLSPSFFVMIVALLFLIGGGTIGGFLNQKLNIVQIEVRPSWSATGAILKETIKQDPLLGSGPNRFINQWLQFKPDAVNNSSFWNSEFRSGVGVLPTFSVTTGVLGVVAWAVFLLFFFYYGLKSLFSFSKERSGYALYSSFILAAYFWVISFFYIPNVTLFAFAFLMTGIFIGASVYEGKIKKYSFSFFDNPRSGFVSVLALIALMVLVIASSYTLSRQLFALKNFHKARIAFSVSGDLNQAERLVNKAINQGKSDVYYRALAEIKAGQITELLSRQDASSQESYRAEFQSVLGEGINAGRQASQFDATNYANWLSLARVYSKVVPFVSGGYENALAALGEARARNPKSPFLILEHARLEVANGNIHEARRYIGESLQMKPDYANAIFLLAQIQFSEGNVSEAVRSIEEATLVAPNDEGLFFQLGLLKFNSDDYRGAASALLRAVALNPQFANAKYFLGLSHANAGRSDLAIEQFEDLARSNPDSEEVQQILRNLKSGRDPFGALGREVLLEERESPPFDE